MNDAIQWIVPPSVQRWLDEVPADRPVALLLRHSVRDELPPNDVGYQLPITEDGVRIARELGAALGPRLRTLHASPVHRCIETAEALRTGAAADLPIVPDRLLGDPGVFVVDGQRAWPVWKARGAFDVVHHQITSDEPLPGMARPDPAARFLVHHMLATAGDVPGVHVYVTHDSVITTAAARLLASPDLSDQWPWFLEGAFFWPGDDTLHGAYRDRRRPIARAPLCGLDEDDVIELARREVARTIGLGTGARFFLAGGAFKTLLTGRPPRDLDLWAPSPGDRARLLDALHARGARPLPAGPFADAFEIADRVVEVPRKVQPATLAERLARFDLALSAVGAEHRPDDQWTAIVHPRARLAAERRQVLLLEPLVNWKYALATLERMRRYAAELDYEVPPDQEAVVWSVFDAQTPEMRAGMLDRYRRTGLGGFGVLEEATCRHHHRGAVPLRTRQR